MKEIELTPERTSKLIEMCKKLFPNFLRLNARLYLVFKTDNMFTHNKIHWYEFTMNQLLLAVEELDEKGEMGYIRRYDHNKINPVDYLYEQFKEIV